MQTTKMKTAICFTGTGRSLNHTWENIKKNLIEPHQDCDIFAHLTPTKHIDKLQKLLDYKQTVKTKIEKDLKLDVKDLRWQHMWPMGTHSGPEPQQTYLNMLYSRSRCGQILADHSLKNNINYDKVIFSRLDVEYYGPLPEMELDKICVPDFHHFTHLQGTGCNDRFAASSYDNMMTYFNLYHNIPKFIAVGGKLHAESFLGWHLLTSGKKIKKYHIRFTRVRPNGDRIDSRLQNRALESRDY
jgi:hypothetical protein